MRRALQIVLFEVYVVSPAAEELTSALSRAHDSQDKERRGRQDVSGQLS